jgi:peptide-methionine (S)-S-oxide reductase
MKIFFMTISIVLYLQGANMKQATVGGGCFWCLEAIYNSTKGVKSAISGYSAGDTQDPTYKEICNGDTNHAEVVQVTYDEDIISYKKILEIFFKMHDPTTLNRQGNDVGTQYRSIILYHDEAQKDIAIDMIKQQSKYYDNKIVTQLEKLEKFYPAEDYHQNYLENNPNQPYCSYVVKPKVDKYKSTFKELIK